MSCLKLKLAVSVTASCLPLFTKNISEQNSVTLPFPGVSVNSHSEHRTYFALGLPFISSESVRAYADVRTKFIQLDIDGFKKLFLGMGLRLQTYKRGEATDIISFFFMKLFLLCFVKR